MMTTSQVEKLLQEHRLYDQYVDVVSAFEWLFSQVSPIRDTVLHFERFPKVRGTDGNPATPDFSVVFADGTGLVGEIARIALAEESVDSLCHQIARYDSLLQLPGANGWAQTVSHTDVLLLVPIDIGTDVVRRVIKERMMDETHSYTPNHPPCIVQFVPMADTYLFQRRPDPENGELRDRSRQSSLGEWLSRGDFKPRATGFAPLKAQKPFMNDPVAPLYLACQLWTKVFPTLAADVQPIADYRPIITTLSELTTILSQRYGRVGRSALRGAMNILVSSRCAEPLSNDEWRIAWGDLAHRPGEEIGEVLARRTHKPPSKGPIRRLTEAYADLGISDPTKANSPMPGTLF